MYTPGSFKIACIGVMGLRFIHIRHSSRCCQRQRRRCVGTGGCRKYRSVRLLLRHPAGHKNHQVQRRSGEDNISYEDYLEYTVFIRANGGKTHRIVADDDDTLYNYYRIGDRVRRHAGLNTFEKYDKTDDKFIQCNACATLCDIGDDVCFRCKCPLLK